MFSSLAELIDKYEEEEEDPFKSSSSSVADVSSASGISEAVEKIDLMAGNPSGNGEGNNINVERLQSEGPNTVED